jgi:hypothetical protein
MTQSGTANGRTRCTDPKSQLELVVQKNAFDILSTRI